MVELTLRSLALTLALPHYHTVSSVFPDFPAPTILSAIAALTPSALTLLLYYPVFFKVMDTHACQKFHRFLELPLEIRQNIYGILLCSFEEPWDDYPLENVLDIVPAEHKIETAILCTSRRVYLEANDVMIKTNRFVHVKSAGGFPMRVFLSMHQVPVVAVDEGPARKSIKRRTERFKGYVLEVAMVKRGGKVRYEADSPIAPCSLMMLGRDMNRFCDALNDGDENMHNFSKTLKMRITVAPTLVTQVAQDDSLTEFFSEKTQQSLLRPFRTILRGLKAVQIRGAVDEKLAKAIRAEIAQDQYLNPQEALDTTIEKKEFGNRLFREGKAELACTAWYIASTDIEKMHRGSSWDGLTQKGGREFVNKMAELYFLCKLNAARIYLQGAENGHNGAETSAEDALVCADSSLGQGFWGPCDPDWVPSDAQLAKLRYRQVVCLRLGGCPSGIAAASGLIHEAMMLAPNDPAILREHDAIAAWRDHGF